MTLKILVEPARFIFNICKKSFSDYESEIKYFDSFYENLLDLVEIMQKEKFYIAVSEDLYEIFRECFPANAYDLNKYPRAKQISSDLGRILNSLFKRPYPSYGENGLDIEFSDDCADKVNNLYNTDAYIAFRDLVGNIFKGSLPSAVLKSNENSIFLKSYVEVEDRTNRRKTVMEVCVNIDKVIHSKHIQRIKNILELFNDIDKDDIDIQKVSCTSTNTHDSMWGIKIRQLNDIPEPERNLLKQMILTGMVIEITFLDFNNIRSKVYEEPMIAIHNITSMSNADILECILYGKGDKNNCQRVSIEIKKGKGHILADTVSSKLTEESLMKLLLHKAM